MPTKDGFDLANEPEQQGLGKAWDRAVISSRLLKASILVSLAAAISIAIVSVGNPVKLFAVVPASVVDKPALQFGADQSTPTVQSTADAKAVPPTAKDAPSRDEVAAASEPTGQNQIEHSELSSEALFREFKAWAAEKDAQAQVGPVQQPVQDAPAKAAGNTRALLGFVQNPRDVRPVYNNAPAEMRPVQRHRHVRPVSNNAPAEMRPVQHRHVRPLYNARAEIRPVQNPRKKVRREQNARVVVPSAQDARARVQYVQNPLLQIYGWGN
jgi:hypothetical protein